MDAAPRNPLRGRYSVTALLTLAGVIAAMLAETAVSTRNERQLRAAGAVEPPDDVYRAMALVYPAAFVVLCAEGFVRDVGTDRWFLAGLGVLIAAKGLKYWAVTTLGPRWTFRVLVPPASTRIERGPYRLMAHPNYLAVAGELTGAAIAMHAAWAGVPAVVAFVLLMLRRIRIEERALSSPADERYQAS
jgi:methyltransferase